MEEQRHLARLGLQAEHVLEGLKRAAFYDPIDCIDGRGRLLPFHEMPASARACLQLRFDTHGRISGQFERRIEALRALAEHFQLLAPIHDITPAPSGPVTVNFTEVYVDGLNLDELRLMKKLLHRKAELEAARGGTTAPPLIEQPAAEAQG